MTWPAGDRGIAASRALLLVAFGVYAIHAIAYGGWISDDAGISFTYARNLAAGHGLVLNPGGERVEGYSNPLWVFLLCPFFAAGAFHPVLVPKVLSIALTVASLGMLARVSRASFGDGESILHAFPSLLLAFHAPFVTWSVSGLENPLYVFLILAGLGRQLRELSRAGSLPLSALLFFLVAITRPEGIVYVAAAFAHRAGRALLHRRADGILAWSGVFIAAFAAYHAWHYSYFADLVPNTFYAKIAGDGGWRPGGDLLDPGSRGWGYVRDGLAEHHLMAVLPASLALLLWRPAPATFLIGLMTGVGILAAAAMGGDWMPQYRFLSPVFALSYLLLGGAAIRLRELLRAALGDRAVTKAALAVPLALAGAWLTAPSAGLLIGGSRHLTVNIADKMERGERFGALAASLGVEGGSLLDPDLGGTSYASGLEMIDLAGLADLHIALHGHDSRFFGDYVFEERKPTFIHTHCFWSMTSDLHSYPALRSDYVPIWERPCESSCCPDALDGEYVRRDVFLSEGAIESSGGPVVLDGGIALVGLAPSREVASPGDTVRVSSFWRRTGEPAGDPVIRLSLEGKGIEVTTEERRFGHGIFPPSLWRPDETIREEWEIRIPEEAVSGMLSIGITVAGAGPTTGRSLGAIEVDRGKVADLARRDLEEHERFLAEGRTEEALASLSRACGIDPRQAACHGQLDATRVRRQTEIWRDSGDLIRRGDLEAATRMLLEAEPRLGRRGAIADRLSECSRLWHERGRDLSAREDAFLFWDEAFDSFARAIECDPSNSFAMKALERSRAAAAVARLHGDRLAAAQAGSLEPGRILDVLLEIQDAGFPAQVFSIIAGSEPIRGSLEKDGSLGAMALLHEHHRRRGDGEALREVTARLHAIANPSILVDGQVALLGSRTQAVGIGAARFTWWLEVIGPVTGDLRMVLRAERTDGEGGTVSLDHFLPESSRVWPEGAIVRHTHTALLRSGPYRFGFALARGASDSPGVLTEMDPLDLSRKARSGGNPHP